MIKILAACGAGVNSSHQIKSALEEELSNRGYDVHCDAVMVKDVNEDLMKGYDIFTPIAATDLGFEPGIPVIEAGPILFCIPAMSVPVFDNIRLFHIVLYLWHKVNGKKGKTYGIRLFL
ncbi:PTS sugar transporter subunit IIB [Streptococcus pneumoniae]|uniref:PTS sugar transporter subunit IIB n=8 Tax=Streptococcus pneumoniae TaxID=1313 RepID=UPI0005DF0F07|nr:PTS sugar transporter subunit IIB [Streptococcus pneumoniae]CKF52280.1 PTS system galactose-specific transporter subunit IIB [Streptococcus pneumoniae]